MKKLIMRITEPLALLLILSMVPQAQEGFKTLDEISVNGKNISIKLSGEVKYNAFKISNPPKIVIELSNTEHNLKSKEMEVNDGIIKRIRSGQFQNEPTKTARVVLDLVKMVEYEISSKDNVVTLTINPEEKTLDEEKDTAKTEKEEIKTVSEAPSVEPALTESKQSVQGKVPETAVSPTAVVSKSEPVAENTEEKKAIPKKSKKKTSETKKTEFIKKSDVPVFSSKPVTLDFEDADIRDVLRILSLKSGINIIYGPDVAGTITLRLENVAFDKAFETILTLNNLVSQAQGKNIVRVATPQQISTERSQAVTFTEIYPLCYADAKDVETNLNAIRTAEGRKGNISVDERTNSLIITDTPEGLSSAKRIIAELDRKPSQVMIEAKIVEVILTDSFDLGVQWEYASTAYNEQNVQGFIGATESSVSDDALGTEGAVGGSVIRPLTVSEGGTGVSLPAAAASGQMGSFSFGILANSNLLTGVLTTLAQKGLSKILSNPKVTTLNNKEARIMVGQKIPYTTTTVSSGGSTQSTQFLDVGIKLTVTPTINVDKRITLQIHPEVSLFVRADAAGPIVGTREAETTVLVNNGETVVIGGLISEEDRKLGTMVPLLGNLPIIGHMFRRDYSTKERTELLVFVTPQIIE